VILLPDNLFYNTTAAGVIVVLSKRKPPARKDKIVLLNASRRVKKGQPKNFIPEDDIRPLAAAFLKAEPVKGEIAVVSRKQAEEADYNLSPSRWVGPVLNEEQASIAELTNALKSITNQQVELDHLAFSVLSSLREVQNQYPETKNSESQESEGRILPDGWAQVPFARAVQLQRGFDLPTSKRELGAVPVFGSNGVVGMHKESPTGIPVPGVMVGRSGSVGKVSYSRAPYWPLNTTLFASNFSGNDELYVSYFLRAFDFSKFAQGVSVPTLNRNSFADQSVALPPPSEQRTIAAVLQILDREIEHNEKRRAALDDLFKALLHKLMTGEIRVADLDLSALAPTRTAEAGQ
jgi:hypothetical protein